MIKKPVPENISKNLTTKIEVPAWGVFCILITGAFSFGILYNQLSLLVKNQDKTDLMYERQVLNINNVDRHERVLVLYDQRLTNLERDASSQRGASQRDSPQRGSSQ